MMRTAISFCAAAALSLATAPEALGSDAGPDGGQDDAGVDFCDTVSDPCCLDDAPDGEVLAASGCNGFFAGPSEAGATGGECSFDPEAEGPFGNCSGTNVCWPFPNWYTQYPEATGGECGLCLPWCASLGGCPDGHNEDPETYDMCSSDCPGGMRCWVYESGGSTRGLCVADCEDGSQCSSGVCDPLWSICVPRIDGCEPPFPTDSGTEEDSGPEGDGGTVFEVGGKASSGCMCDSVSASPGEGFLEKLVRFLVP